MYICIHVGTVPTSEEAWKLVRMCGLSIEFIGAPETFNVGKGGRNLPLDARQVFFAGIEGSFAEI